jgi:NTE family protein
VVATDLATGERVVFDTRRGGTRIGPEHLLASCALPPDFVPVEVGGRLLGDGGLSTNAPLDLVLDEAAVSQEALVCVGLDLFARKGDRPRSLADAAARGVDLMFSNQSALILEGREREHRLREVIGRMAARLPSELRQDPETAGMLTEGRGARAVLRLAYRALAGEVGSQKTFDFSRGTLMGRWEAGARDMRAALSTLAALPADTGASAAAAGLMVHEVGADPR